MKKKKKRPKLHSATTDTVALWKACFGQPAAIHCCYVFNKKAVSFLPCAGNMSTSKNC